MKFYRRRLGFIIHAGPYSFMLTLERSEWGFHASHHRAMTILRVGPLLLVRARHEMPF